MSISDPLDTEEVRLKDGMPTCNIEIIIVWYTIDSHAHVRSHYNLLSGRVRSISKLPSVLQPVNLTGRITVTYGSVMLTVILTRGGYMFLSCFRCMI